MTRRTQFNCQGILIEIKLLYRFLFIFSFRSGTQGIEQLSQLSNIRSPGVWLYRIDESEVFSCLQPDLQPPYCDAQSPTLVTRRPSQVTFQSTTAFITSPDKHEDREIIVTSKSKNIEKSRSTSPVPRIEVGQTGSSTSQKSANKKKFSANAIGQGIIEEEQSADVFDITFPPSQTFVPKKIGQTSESGQGFATEVGFNDDSEQQRSHGNSLLIVPNLIKPDIMKSTTEKHLSRIEEVSVHNLGVTEVSCTYKHFTVTIVISIFFTE